MNRQNMLARLGTGKTWDLIIIGGGATGLGVAVDAAARGYSTLLVEARDFAQGTSSRSTKLVHGGVRYLEQGDVPLVLEALRERGLLHQNAPHLVQHLSFIVPNYRWWEAPFFGIGLKIYDALAGRLNLARSRMLSREETLRLIPNVEPEHLLGGVEYFDGQFDDARLAITLALTASDHGATLLNHCPVTALLTTDGMVDGVRFDDSETGRTFLERAKVVINATGIFADTIRHMEDASAPRAVQPSQGVHLVLDRDFLKGDSAIMVPHTDDGRVLFVIPWHDRVLVGTTDTPMDHPDIEPRPLAEEVAFILRNAARYLARDPVESDILSVFAGQRPLVRRPSGDGKETKAISRNHEILVSQGGLVTIVGGKWTTYRKMAEDTVNHAAQIAGLEDRTCITTNLHLHGWSEHPPQDQPDFMRHYGSDAPALNALEMQELLHPALPYPKACVVWAVRQEMARTVEDLLSRRTRALLLNANAAVEAAPETARLLAAELGHDSAWQHEQVQAFEKLAEGYRALPATQ